jgi:predicted ester cyclase
MDGKVDVARLFRYGIKAVNARDWKTHRALLTDRYRFVDYGNELTLTNADDYVAYQTQAMAAFPDEQLTIKTLVTEGRTAFAELVAQGTHTQSMTLPAGGQIPATGRSFTQHLVCVAEYDDAGRCRSTRVYHSPSALLAQLGIGPSIPQQIRLDEPASTQRKG